MKLDLQFTGLSNTKDRALVGANCYSMSNVNLDRGILEAAQGYTMVITALGSAAQGLGFGRFGGVTEAVAVVGSKAYAATGATWALLSTVASGNWEFCQFGPHMYGVCENSGLTRHTIGTSDWTGSTAPPAPTSSPTSAEKFYNSGLGYPNNSLCHLIRSKTWTPSGDFATAPTMAASGNFSVQFMYNYQYNNSAYLRPFTHVMVWNVSGFDMSYMDWLEFQITQNYLRAAGTLDVNSLRVSLIMANGSALIPLYGNGIMLNNNRQAVRRFYWLGNRSDRTDVRQIRFEWDFYLNSGAFYNTDGFTIGIKAGDVWQNNTNGFLVSAGPVGKTRTYAYSTYDNSEAAESNLSPTHTSIYTPTGILADANPGSYTAVTLSAVASGNLTTGDTLKLYRRRLSDNTFVYVGSGLNSGSPIINDKLMEWELASLNTHSYTANLPVTLKPQSIGKFKGSLALGIGYDLYISKVDRPTEYEEIGSAPDPSDLSQGRSLYVDDSRSQKLLTITGDNVLYLGTANRTYVMYGDAPYNYIPPRAVANVGPIGKRAACAYGNGLAIANAEGIWLVTYNDTTDSRTGDLSTLELTQDIRNTYQSLTINASSVLLEHRGDLWLLAGTDWLRLSKTSKGWTKGTFLHSLVAAAPDYEGPMRALTASGGLAYITSGSSYAGSSINWSYTTGDVVVERSTIDSVFVIASGSPSMTIEAFDGSYGSSSQTYTINPSSYSVTDLRGSQHRGTRFRFTFSGTEADKVIKCELGFKPIQESKGR